MASLPLKVRAGIRDHWTKEDAPVQAAIGQLQETLGLQVDVEPEWPLLLGELDSFYPDKGGFAAAVSGAVETWAKAMLELLDDDKNEQWTDNLLENLKSSWSRLRLFVDVSKDTQPSTEFSQERGGFVITLPRRALQPYELFPVYKGEIHSCFDRKKKPTSVLSSRPAPTPGDDWADVEVDRTTGKLDIVEKAEPATEAGTGGGQAPTKGEPKPEFLPRANTLPRPDALLLRPPYHLLVRARSLLEVEIQCSHSPSLALIADYLRLYSRTNHNVTTKPPSVEIKLHQAAFGLGAMYDRLVLTAENRYGSQQTLSPTIVLALVEGTLGYESVYTDGVSWAFRRDVTFGTM